MLEAPALESGLPTVLTALGQTFAVGDTEFPAARDERLRHRGKLKPQPPPAAAIACLENAPYDSRGLVDVSPRL